MTICKVFDHLCFSVKDEPVNNKDPIISMNSMMDLDTENHIDNNLSDGAAFSDEEDDMPLGRCPS